MHRVLSRAHMRAGDVNLCSGPQMQEYRAIARRIRADHPSRVLDWGCGYGHMTDLLSRAGLDVTAFEYRPDTDEGVRPLERYPHLSAHFGSDPRSLPFPDCRFDAVLSCGVLEHVEDPDASLEEIRRVLVPSGMIYVYKLPNRTSYLEAIARRAGLYYHGAFDNDRLYDRCSAVALLRRHGYEVLEVRLTNMLPLTLTSSFAARAARPIWATNRALSAVSGLNRLATNVELVARVTSRSSARPSLSTATISRLRRPS